MVMNPGRCNTQIGADHWWITTGLLAKGGEKKLGPFDSLSLAIDVRTYVEKAEGREGAYWIDSEIGS